MTIRLKDGSGFETRPGSNILIKGDYLHWISYVSGLPCTAALANVKQVEP